MLRSGVQLSSVLPTDGYKGVGDTVERIGNKIFELSNHLGNVLVTVSDKKVPVSVDGSSVDHYRAEVLSASDYYAFGNQVFGRTYQAG